MTRATAGLAVLAVILLALPAFAGAYALSVATLILYFAYAGQAWNIMMGFAGQLSLGHAIYVGLGGYTSAALFVHFGIGPWLALPAVMFAIFLSVVTLWLVPAMGACVWARSSGVRRPMRRSASRGAWPPRSCQRSTARRRCGGSGSPSPRPCPTNGAFVGTYPTNAPLVGTGGEPASQEESFAAWRRVLEQTTAALLRQSDESS